MKEEKIKPIEQLTLEPFERGMRLDLNKLYVFALLISRQTIVL